MKALFYTTQTSDCANHVRAWESAYGPAVHVSFDHRALCNDWQLMGAIEEAKPAVIFYIGACKAPGNPKPQTFINARARAPMVNLCSDAMDKPWHPVLAGYKARGCFDLQVSIDGAMSAPVDLVTLTPVDPRRFEQGEAPARDIRCGFSGSVGRHNDRSEIILALKLFGGLTVRDRAKAEGYADHVRFLRRCRMVLNISRTGTGMTDHVKGRVLEAGWAGAALLESEGSPIAQWFPPDCYLTYGDPKDAARLIKHLDDETLDRVSRRLAEEVRARFKPEDIYGAMLERIGIVRPPVAA